uniref:Uncharacterized protein n=1 Tax=Setaria italica TaxID=4555 RepID=K4APE8_SETIT
MKLSVHSFNNERVQHKGKLWKLNLQERFVDMKICIKILTAEQ